MLVDELAHSNAAGSRHPKRWQDVEELLAAGIDVYTTVNVQHLESLNDIVGGITGIQVWETVPDRVFDQADEVVLVDLPPDELLQRLKEGKVYLPQQANGAIQQFLPQGQPARPARAGPAPYRRPGGRGTMRGLPARPVDGRGLADARTRCWSASAPAPGGEKLVRSAARLAAQFDVPWHAVYVETPELQRLPEARRDAILRESSSWPQELGAKTATLPGQDAARVAADLRPRTTTWRKIVVGRRSAGWRACRSPGSAACRTRFGALAPDIDVIQVALGGEAREDAAQAVEAPFANPIGKAGGRTGWRQYGLALAAVVAVTLLATPLHDILDLANIVMLFLLAVLLCRVQTTGAARRVLASFLSAWRRSISSSCSPRLSFAVSDAQYLLTFAVMLAVALIIGHLTAGLRFQARVAASRERRMRALYEMARELSSALVLEQIEEIGDRFVSSTFGVHAHLLLPDDQGKLLRHTLCARRGCSTWASRNGR